MISAPISLDDAIRTARSKARLALVREHLPPVTPARREPSSSPPPEMHPHEGS